MIIIYIYNKDLKLIGQPYVNNFLEFKEKPSLFFPEWETSFYATEHRYIYPIRDSITQEVREMTKYEKFKKGLYELQFNEVEYQGDILTLKEGQYVDEHGILQNVPKIDGTRIEWNWTTHIWEEKATNLEIVQAQYKDYEEMDTPSTLEEMKQQDPALATEYLNMMIELRSLIYTLSTNVQLLAEDRTVGFAALPIPQPSKALKDFKNKFKLTK